MPDNEELAKPAISGEKEAVNTYDSKHGTYQDRQGQNTSTGAKPKDCDNPLKLNG